MSEPNFIPQPFQAQSNSIATYNYFDIAEGTGVQKLYGFNTGASGALAFSLGSNPVYSDSIDESIATGTSTAWVSKINKQFDLSPFNLSKVIAGSGIVNFTISAVGGGGGQTFAYANVSLYHVKSDGTATELCSNNSQTILAGAGLTVKKIFNVPLTIPRTYFEIGQYLRLQIVIYVRTNGVAGSVAFAYDPQNRDGTYIIPSTDAPGTISKVEFYCPFKLSEIGY